MKRNIIVILTLALVCVLFVACGKEEVAPIDIAIGELQAARENIDNQIAALEAQRPATIGDSTVIPVGKTREEMTEPEREAYDRAKIAEFAEQAKNDPSIDVEATAKSGAIHNMGYYYDGSGDGVSIPMYIPNLDELPEEYRYLAMPSVVVGAAFPDAITSDEWNFLHDYLVNNPEYLVPLGKLLYEYNSSFCIYYDRENDEEIAVWDEAIRNEFIVTVRNIVDKNKSAG